MAGTVSSYNTANGRRWEVRYRKPNKATTRKRGFLRKRDAEEFLATVTVSKSSGGYIDPSDARVTVSALYPTWLDTKRGLKPSSFDGIPRKWENYVAPEWGDREIASIRPSEIQAWVTSIEVDRSASTALKAFGVLAGILDMAAEDQRIPRNPARGLKNLPKPPKRKTGRHYLSPAEAELLASLSAYPTLVRLLTYTGIRWGEAAALKVRAVNEVRRRITIEENASTVSGVVQVGSPKPHEVRTVPYPKTLAGEIRDLCAGKGPDDLLFPSRLGGYMKTPHHTTGWFEAAVRRTQEQLPAMPRITVHDLRHTAASIAVSSGANVKVLQRMLGHESAAMTLDVYGDLFPDDLDAVVDAMEAVLSTARARVS